MKLHFRIAALGAVSVLLFAACGGGSSSSGRTRNAALNCYADQTAKDDAVSEAQAAFDASFGGNPPPSDDSVPDSSVPDSSVPDSSVPDSSVPDTSVPAEETPDTLSSDGGGYRRPAIRHFATVPPTESGDSVALTEEQLALQLELQAAEEMQLCESSDTTTSSNESETIECTGTLSGTGDNWLHSTDCPDATFETTRTSEGNPSRWFLMGEGNEELVRGNFDGSPLSADNPIVVNISYQRSVSESSEPSDTTIASDTETIECTGTVSGTPENISLSKDCGDGEFVVYSDESGSMNRLWRLVRLSDSVEFARGYIDLSALSVDNPVVVNISYKKPVSESSDGPFEPGCPGDVPTFETDVESPTTQNIVHVSTSNPSGECDSSIIWAVVPKSLWDAALRGEPFTSAPPCSFMMETECELEAGDYVIFAGFAVNLPFYTDEPYYEGWQDNFATMNFTVTGGGESGTCQGVQLEIVDPQWVRVDNCSDSLHSFSLVGLGPIPLNMVEDNQINIEDGLPEGWIDMTYLAEFTDGSTERGSFTQCWACEIQPLELAFSPENPKIGDAIWFSSDFAECFSEESIWRAYLETTLSSSSAFHQPFRPSQSRKYLVRATGICSDGSEVYAEADIEPQAIAAPAHDNINDAQRIEGAKGSATGTTLGATREIDEPVHTDCSWESETTSWLIWTAPKTGALTTSMTGTSFGHAGSRTYTRQTMQRVPFTFDDDWNAHLNVVEGTEYAIAIMSCYDSNFGDFVFNWEMDTREDASPSAFGIPSVGNGNTPAQEAPVDVTTITTADNGVSTLVVEANANELVFSDTDLDALRALAGVTTGDVFVQLDSGQVIQLNKLGKTKIRLGDTKNLKVIVPGAKVQDVVIQLKRTENGNTSSSSTSGGMSPISMLLIAFLVLALIGGGALQLRRKQGVN